MCGPAFLATIWSALTSFHHDSMDLFIWRFFMMYYQIYGKISPWRIAEECGSSMMELQYTSRLQLGNYWMSCIQTGGLVGADQSPGRHGLWTWHILTFTFGDTWRVSCTKYQFHLNKNWSVGLLKAARVLGKRQVSSNEFGSPSTGASTHASELRADIWATIVTL